MNVVLAFPVLAPVLGAVVALAVHRRVGPAAAAWALAAIAVAMTAGVVAAAAFYALAGVVPGERTGWCRALLGHDVDPHPLAAIAAAGFAVTVVTRSIRWWIRYRRTLAELPTANGAPLLVLDRSDPVAYAHPGHDGRVVVSTGLMARLAPTERLVVLAHERAHLDLHHSRFRVAVGMAAAGCPLAAPLARAVRRCTERAADEAAARVVGDRGLVAVAITKAAMAQAPSGVAGVSGSSIVARVEALLAPEPRLSFTWTMALVASAFIAVAGAAFQAHHLAEVVLHVG